MKSTACTIFVRRARDVFTNGTGLALQIGAVLIAVVTGVVIHRHPNR
jgi:flagellar biosynthesis component FlhA